MKRPLEKVINIHDFIALDKGNSKIQKTTHLDIENLQLWKLCSSRIKYELIILQKYCMNIGGIVHSTYSRTSHHNQESSNLIRHLQTTKCMWIFGLIGIKGHFSPILIWLAKFCWYDPLQRRKKWLANRTNNLFTPTGRRSQRLTVAGSAPACSVIAAADAI